MPEIKFTYVEPKKALGSRIAAHLKYSNFNLHGWIKENFDIKSGQLIFDLGCGNGNFIGLFWDAVKPEGYILGIDKNEALIEEAVEKYKDLGSNVKLLVHDFDNPMPETDKKFDWVFANYSLYYTADGLKLVEIIKDIIVPGGKFVVIGPGPKNTIDLNEFNYEVTGRKPKDEHIERIVRIYKEFKPLFEDIFSKENVEYQEVDSVMTFPEAEAFGDYYFSTLLWRESVKDRSAGDIDLLKQKIIEHVSSNLPAKIKKQMSCLIATATV